ncbi:MAG: 2-amino-4-hydroxy-6-hydroxymethyldihydropteridine diphosphokinase [Candidatus Thiodiazotropha sp.]|jgi:2-amino-4-hydroxy-6-hydroxymethyldihydropteridine diphosphokinase
MSDLAAVTAYIGLGSNLANPRRQLETAIHELAGLDSCHLLCHSSLYRTRPVGPQDQPDFINAVACLSTQLEEEPLLDALQGLEQLHHRVRKGKRWGPRTLDLDLLLYGDRIINTPRLKVPHPEMLNRAFVLTPLKEIAPPQLIIPGVGALTEILQESSEKDIEPGLEVEQLV